MRWVVGEHESGGGVETSVIDDEYASLLAVMSRQRGRVDTRMESSVRGAKQAGEADPDEHARGVQW